MATRNSRISNLSVSSFSGLLLRINAFSFSVHLRNTFSLSCFVMRIRAQRSRIMSHVVRAKTSLFYIVIDFPNSRLSLSLSLAEGSKEPTTNIQIRLSGRSHKFATNFIGIQSQRRPVAKATRETISRFLFLPPALARSFRKSLALPTIPYSRFSTHNSFSQCLWPFSTISSHRPSSELPNIGSFETGLLKRVSKNSSGIRRSAFYPSGMLTNEFTAKSIYSDSVLHFDVSEESDNFFKFFRPLFLSQYSFQLSVKLPRPQPACTWLDDHYSYQRHFFGVFHRPDWRGGDKKSFPPSAEFSHSFLWSMWFDSMRLWIKKKRVWAKTLEILTTTWKLVEWSWNDWIGS